MFRKGFCTALVVGWAWGSPAVSAQSAESAQRFIETIYARPVSGRASSRLFAKGGDAIASSSLLALIEKGSRAKPDDAGVLGLDPLCHCRNGSGFKPTSIHAVMSGSHAAKGSVSLMNSGEETRVVLSLVWESDGWRIDDIQSGLEKGLRYTLAEEITQKYSEPKYVGEL